MRKVILPLLVLVLTLGIMSMFMMSAAGAASAPSVWTDKTDYAPGETVIVTATGFWPNEPIHFDAVGSPNGLRFAGNGVTDENGGCIATMQLPDDGDLVYVLTATGGSSGLTAQTTFTDPGTVHYSVVISPTTVSAGATTTYTITISDTLNQHIKGGNITIPSGFSGITSLSANVYDPTGKFRWAWTCSSTSSQITIKSPGGTKDLQHPDKKGRPWRVVVRFSATAPLTPGIYEWTTTCTGDGTPVLDGSQPTVNVISGVLTATTVVLTSSSAGNTSVVGESVTFTATVSGSGGTPTGNVTFLDGGGGLWATMST